MIILRVEETLIFLLQNVNYAIYGTILQANRKLVRLCLNFQYRSSDDSSPFFNMKDP